jgi:RNA polymerase sigma-70 factor, ECF subfamily
VLVSKAPDYKLLPHLACHKVRAGGVIDMVTTTTEVISGMKAGAEPIDIEPVFRAHYDRVARVIARVVRDHARAEELAVEVFLKLWRNGKPPAEKIAPWLYRVAVRSAVDELRRRSRRNRYENLFGFLRAREGPATPEQIHDLAEEQQRVRTVLAQLDARKAEFLILRSHGFSYEELATTLSLNPASIGTFLSRAQHAFRKEYRKRYGNR